MESQKSWMKYCSDHIMRKMRADRYGNLFANPVLEASDSIIPPSVKENYRLVIKNPMDYKTVKYKLDSEMYMSPEEFFEDMKLIYDNCMRFNPPVGSSKWAHDAAVSNLKKFLKIWESSSRVLGSLYQSSLSQPSVASATEPGNFAASESNTGSQGDFNALEHSVTQTGLNGPEGVVKLSQGDSGPDQGRVGQSEGNKAPSSPRNRWSFRLSLQSIQEYKLRKGFVNQAPELDGFAYFEPRTGESEALALDQSLGEFEELSEARTTLDYEPPEVLCKRDDGVMCVSFLAESECGGLLPEWNIIGLSPEKQSYSMSDVSIRYIYNQLYLSDLNSLKFDHKKMVPEEPEPEPEDFSLDPGHCPVKIGLGPRDTSLESGNSALSGRGIFEEMDTDDMDSCTEYSYNHLFLHPTNSINCVNSTNEVNPNYPVNTSYSVKPKPDHNVNSVNNTQLGVSNQLNNTDNLGDCVKPGNLGDKDDLVESSVKNPVDIVDSVYKSMCRNYLNKCEMSDNNDMIGADYGLVAPCRDEVVDLYIDIDSKTTLNMSDFVLLLERNLFSRVCIKDEYFKICDFPQLYLLCSNKGYFKLDESNFTFDNVGMKHIRIFFFNCAKSKVKVSCKRVTFTELVLCDRFHCSSVYNLHNEFKLGNVSNLPFFTLPNSTPISFSKHQDILYRLQIINNSLPVQLLALHIISNN